MDGTDTAAALAVLGTLGIEGYQLSQGQQVSTSIVGGVPVIQSGAAATQTSLFLILGILVVGFLGYVAFVK